MKLLYIYAIILICFYIYYIFTYTNICENFINTPMPIRLPSFETITKRVQWNANYGYCGETSFIDALLYYGGYMSQYNMRALAISLMDDDVQQSDKGGQLLIDGNIDMKVASALGLKSISYTGKNTDEFIKWINTNIKMPVIIGVYMNSDMLECEDCDNCDADPDYDHIVPVISVDYNVNIPIKQDNMKKITICDNGLYTDDKNNPYYMCPNITPMTRKDALCNNSTIYAIPKVVMPTKKFKTRLTNTLKNYGIAITGLLDSNSIPIRIISVPNIETPEMVDGSNDQPDSNIVSLTLYLSKLIRNKKYDLYKCTNMFNIPTNISQTISNKKDNILIQTITATSDTMIINTIKSKDAQGNIINKPITIKSSDTAIFRCYPQDKQNLLKQKSR